MENDLTIFSLGEKSTKLIGENPQLKNTVSTFTTEGPILDSKKIALLLPGIIHTTQVVFEYQIPVLSKLDHDVIGINYSNQAYSQDMLNAQIIDFITNPKNQAKEITLVGVSLGAYAIIDLFGKSNDGNKLTNVKNAILLGTIFSVADLKNGPFGKALKLSSKFAHGPTVERFIPLVKRFIRADVLYAGIDGSRKERLQSERNNLSNKALLDRIEIFGNVGAVEELNNINNVSALFGWWEDDYASPEAKQRLGSLFPNNEEFTINGHHGWTSSNATQINEAINRFFYTKGKK